MTDLSPPSRLPRHRPDLSVVVVGGPPGPALAAVLDAMGVGQVVAAGATGSGATGSGTTGSGATGSDSTGSDSTDFVADALGEIRGELVAFLHASAEPEPAALAAAVDRLAGSHDVAALALRPPSPVSVFATALPGSASGDVLHAPHDAMLARTRDLRAVGGFDRRLPPPSAAMDLGWRLWLAGGRVVAYPIPLWAAATTGDPDRAGDDAAAGDGSDRGDGGAGRAGEAAGSLAMVFRYYEEERQAKALPAAMLLLAASFGPAAADAGGALFSSWLPELEAQRAAAQAARTRRDVELLHLFRLPGERDGQPGEDAGAVVAGFGLDEVFGRRRRVLVVTADVFTERMAGPAIRAWQISSALAEHHDVHLATLSAICERRSDTFTVEAADPQRIAELEQWCDIVILQGYAMDSCPSLRTTSKVMVVDVYDPLHFETLELAKRDDPAGRRAHVGHAVHTLNEQLGRGDFVICASAKQRDLYVGHLSALGRINPTTYDLDPTLRQLIDVVPFGLPDVPARHEHRAIKGVVPGIGVDDEVILWGGGIYNWFDPLTLIRAVDLLRRRRPTVRLFFLGVRHPNPGVNPMLRTAAEARVLSDDLGLTNTHVFFNETWVGYDDRQNYLSEADVGVSTHHDHAETAYSFRTRILDYLWAGLPIVATEGDGFADLIDGEGLGVTVRAGDVHALEAALFRVVDDDGFAKNCRGNVERIRDRFTWSRSLEPLVAFCAAPRRAADLVAGSGGAPAAEPPTLDASVESVSTHGPGVARIAVTLYREGGLRRVARGARTRVQRAARQASNG